MIRESQLKSIAHFLEQGQEVLVICANEQSKIDIEERTKALPGSENLKIKTIDYSKTFQGKVNPGYIFLEEISPISQGTLSVL